MATEALAALVAAQQQIAAQAQHLTALQAQVQQLTAAQAAAPAAASFPAPVPTPVIVRMGSSPPAKFQGGSGFPVRPWLDEVESFFAMAGYTSDADRALSFPTLLTGAAHQWWTASLAAWPAGTPLAWAAIRKAFLAHYVAANEAQVARLDVQRLCHGAQGVPRGAAKMNLHQYITSYQRLMMVLPEMAENERVFNFVAGLPADMQRRAMMYPRATLAESVAEAVGRAAVLMVADRAGSRHRGDDMELHYLGADEDAPTSPGGPAAPAPSSREDALLAAVLALGATQKTLAAQLNALASRPQAAKSGSTSSGGGRPRVGRSSYVEGLSAGVADARRAAGACMKCGQSGHFKNECPNNVKPNM
jgi:hypothetical protein